MKEKLVRRLRGEVARNGVQVILWAMLCLTLDGCRHRTTLPSLPTIMQAPDKPPPAPDAPAMESPPPDTLTTAPSIKVTEAKPKRRSRKSSPKASATAAVEAAVVLPPATVPVPASALGELSIGGESNPKSQQEAGELVSSSEHRLDALMKTKAGRQEAQTREIRHFLQEARQALTTGDAEGAKTLATKARLLMDDLEKWAQQ